VTAHPLQQTSSPLLTSQGLGHVLLAKPRKLVGCSLNINDRKINLPTAINVLPSIIQLLQSYLARMSLDIQLRRIDIFSPEDSIATFGEEYNKFKLCEFFAT